MQNENFNNYNPNLKPLANHLRNHATKAEACLWKYALRAGQMKGYTFRRQRPVLSYIADFMCQPIRLIIELDGGIHNDEEFTICDLKRQETLEAAGYTVLRFRNEVVLRQIEEVRKKIKGWIEDYEAHSGIPEKAVRTRVRRSG